MCQVGWLAGGATRSLLQLCTAGGNVLHYGARPPPLGWALAGGGRARARAPGQPSERWPLVLMYMYSYYGADAIRRATPPPAGRSAQTAAAALIAQVLP